MPDFFAAWPQDILLYSILTVALCICMSLWSIWHIHWREFSTREERLVWLLIAIMLPFLGGFIYFFLGRKKGKKIHET